MPLLLAGAGCDSSCTQVANLLRECCAHGPAELRADCEAEAKLVEEKSGSGACEGALERGDYESCGR